MHARASTELSQSSKQTTTDNFVEHCNASMIGQEQDVINMVEHVASSRDPFDLDIVAYEHGIRG